MRGAPTSQPVPHDGGMQHVSPNNCRPGGRLGRAGCGWHQPFLLVGRERTAPLSKCAMRALPMCVLKVTLYFRCCSSCGSKFKALSSKQAHTPACRWHRAQQDIPLGVNFAKTSLSPTPNQVSCTSACTRAWHCCTHAVSLQPFTRGIHDDTLTGFHACRQLECCTPTRHLAI